VPFGTFIRDELATALASLAPTKPGLRLLSRHDADQVIARAGGTFVNGDPRAWWLSLKTRPASYPYPAGDALDNLSKHVPLTRRCYLIIDTGDDGKPVLETTIASVIDILKSLPFVEYYLVDVQFRWLIVENDHNAVLVVGNPAADDASS
jgi:Family of unknown function (DUF6756)